MYVITCKANGCKYIGVSAYPRYRFACHARAPPFRMRADAARYTPFTKLFTWEVVATYTDRHAAHLKEAALIKHHNTQGPAGYNHLPGAPAFSQHYWVQHRRGRHATPKHARSP